jgi:hypothetical protein
MDDDVGQFVHQRQELLIQAHSGAQYDPPFVSLPQHPGNQGIANDRRTAFFGKPFQAPNVTMERDISTALH